MDSKFTYFTICKKHNSSFTVDIFTDTRTYLCTIAVWSVRDTRKAICDTKKAVASHNLVQLSAVRFGSVRCLSLQVRAIDVYVVVCSLSDCSKYSQWTFHIFNSFACVHITHYETFPFVLTLLSLFIFRMRREKKGDNKHKHRHAYETQKEWTAERTMVLFTCIPKVSRSSNSGKRFQSYNILQILGAWAWNNEI